MPTNDNPMTTNRVLIRRATPDEHNAVGALALAVAHEIYGYDLVPHARFADEDWSRAWIAVSDGKMAGIVLTHDEWIGDLWVISEFRGHGIGRVLLLKGEAEIAARGHRMLRLRVVKANASAVGFYRQMGWQVDREFPHETLPTTMLEMQKHAPSVC